MNPRDRYRDEERIFGEALLVPTAQRDRFLSTKCADDPALKSRLEALLREHEQSRNALDDSPGRALLASVTEETATTAPGDNLASTAARYALGEKLGEGGWGAVYAAEQLHPVRRSVAIKIIKLGMDTRAVVTRFQAERQALALMEHENIARVLDAGETTSGRPFFAMERVHGTRITRYCDDHRLTLRARLQLFMQVCDAVQHAHQKGVVHRDLKPSNLLITEGADGARPKVIDFGIAKATQGRLADETLVTEVDGFIGTPAYMSPEQADQRGDAIDTRSDIYSLGIVLYELLTGCTPLDGVDVRMMGVAEVRRQIRDVEPLRPSACIGRFADDVRRETAERRGLSAAKLRDALAGDLDSVVMKCLEKSPARRYESASALAQDLGRYLNHEPVTASPARQWYVWGKFMRRNRAAFAVAAAIVLLLVGGVAVSTLLLFREKAARERAIAAERAQAQARAAAEKSTRQAKTEATRSARATEFMTSVLIGVKPAVARGRDTELLRELLDEAAARLDSVLQDEPEVEADLRDVIGEAFWHLDEPERAARMHRRALLLHEQSLGPTHPKVGFTLIRLGLFEIYHGDLMEGEKIFKRAADLRLRAFGPEDPRTLDAQFFVVETLTRRKRLSEAGELLDQVRAVQKRIFPPDDLRLLRTEYTLASLLYLEGARSAAERLMREVVARYPADTAGQSLSFFRHQGLGTLGSWLLEQGRIDEAIETLKEGLVFSAAQGQASIGLELLLAHSLHLREQYNEALTILRKTTEQARQVASRDKSNRLMAFLANAAILQGRCLAHVERYAEAEPLLREACSLSLRPNNAITTGIATHPVFDLANMLHALRRSSEVETELESALRQANREGNEFVFQLLPAVYQVHRDAADAARADALVGEQLASEAAWFEKTGPVASAPYSLAVLCAALQVGRHDQIAPVARARLAWWEQHRPTEAPRHAFRVVIGEILRAEKRLDEAERELLVASETLHRTKQHWSFAGQEFIDGALARFYAACARPEQPGRWRELMTSETTDPEWELRLARALVDAGRYHEANEILPSARSRVEERLAGKPGNDRLAAVVAEAAVLAKDCLAKLESHASAELLSRGEK